MERWELKQTPDSPVPPPRHEEGGDGGGITTGGKKIRCPRCAWQPRKDDRWSCRCGHAWNTFDTRGRCPECRYIWDVTQCLSCHEFSLHEAWYVSEPDAP